MSIPGTLVPLSASLALLLGACGSGAEDGEGSTETNNIGAGILAAGDPLGGLTPEQIAAFEVGREDFAEIEEADEGLGPVMNNTGCGVCHDNPATGGSSAAGLTEVRFGFTGPDGSFDPLAELGGSLQQLQGIGEVEEVPGCEGVVFNAEVVPPEANTVGGRLTTPLFGLGLVDAVPDDELRALAAAEAIIAPDTAGRVSEVTNITTGQPDVGRFGWKAQVATLADFSGDAYLNEMGITNPLFPSESCPQGNCDALACDPTPDPEDDGTALNNFTTFTTLLAPLPTLPVKGQAVVGAGVFAAIGCADCHTPALVTGSSADPVFDGVTFHPFSDFLLHDMGSLGDQIVQGGTGAGEMRTAPLWGARVRTSFLHDGRASNLTDAILAHAGQGQGAADDFADLDGFLQDALIVFLNTL